MKIIGRIGPREGLAEVRGFGDRLLRLQQQLLDAFESLPGDIVDGRLKEQRDNCVDEIQRLADMLLVRAAVRGDVRLQWVSESGRAAPQ